MSINRDELVANIANRLWTHGMGNKQGGRIFADELVAELEEAGLLRLEPETKVEVPEGEGFWSFFPDLPRKSVITALQIIDDNEFESTIANVRKYAERDAREEAYEGHQRHVNLLRSCYLCRVEAGAQTDRLTDEEES